MVADETAAFLKVRFGPVYEPGFLVPWALTDHGVPNVLAPFPTRTSDLWAPLAGDDGSCVVLFHAMVEDNVTLREEASVVVDVVLREGTIVPEPAVSETQEQRPMPCPGADAPRAVLRALTGKTTKREFGQNWFDRHARYCSSRHRERPHATNRGGDSNGLEGHAT